MLLSSVYVCMYVVTEVCSERFFFRLQADSNNISILLNAEKRREGLNELLDLADYAICSTNFPMVRPFPEHFSKLRINRFLGCDVE